MDELDYDDAVLRTRSSEKLTGDFESLWQILDLTRRENRFRTSRYSHDRLLVGSSPLVLCWNGWRAVRSAGHVSTFNPEPR